MPGQRRHEGRRHRRARARAVLGRGAVRHVDVDVALLEELVLDAQACGAAERTTVRAASTDSFITSPSEPVR